MKASHVFVTALAGLAWAQPLPQQETTSVTLHARQIPNPLAIPLALAQFPQGVLYFFTLPIQLLKSIAAKTINQGAGALNGFLDKSKAMKGKHL
ncbi:hypothetical protein GQ602_001576 [Ophiocordyceps camponoti-floridani]|uniref:Uncharacterized protein n=1 Tax=Ophiocordyceps camponoti-floridani TaxID=2030778 RepID=A0A8H4VHF8_9HYPO|nr:hypothetical protein GQ602_001576 [Ophiocordyceps camponoti-floridani]